MTSGVKNGMEEFDARRLLLRLGFPEGNVVHALAVVDAGGFGYPGNGLEDWGCEISRDPTGGYIITFSAREEPVGGSAQV